MPSVGGVSCLFVRGTPGALTQRVQTWEIPGFDGSGAQLLGRHEGDFSFRLTQWGTVTEIKTWLLALEAVKNSGDLVTVVNDFDISYTNMLLREFGQPRFEGMIDPTTPATTTRAVMDIGGARIA